ncbi:transcription antitermination factor NusB [Solicola gregarius]|uniref:Transcription antitermination protein NusB n=1 Tax=Solicola gregarius TaxID=2908642 RepID=A0AA46TGB9_9ACTN|nr:transcription antitermination factor NusB [Solicola gregarius]UYM04839.1 transcription antitermination factor NusB [Solicola gregarius]
MAARAKARKRALDVLYECELRGVPLGETLAGRVAEDDPPVNEYTVTLVEGVAAHRERLDALLAEHAVGWTLERMPTVDRNLLRIGAYEILYVDDVPDGVAVSEAVALAKDLSTDESPGFVNGLLAQLVKVKPSLPA